MNIHFHVLICLECIASKNKSADICTSGWRVHKRADITIVNW